MNNLNVIYLNYEQSNETKEILRKSIDGGCQAFIISEDIFDEFLEDFYEVHDQSLQVYPNKHVIVYSLEKSSLFERISKFKSIEGMVKLIKKLHEIILINCADLPNILFIEYDASSSKILFATTKFGGRNSESATIEKIYEIGLEKVEMIEPSLKDVNLFPVKTKNLQGREITLAIFNYMPYTLWAETVSL